MVLEDNLWLAYLRTWRFHLFCAHFRCTDSFGSLLGYFDTWFELELIRRELMSEDAINHPKHYTFGKFEVIDVIEDWQLNYHLGAAVKYIARAKHKGTELQDLKKAQWYINREIERQEKK